LQGGKGRECARIPPCNFPCSREEFAILARKCCDNRFISIPYAFLTTAPEGASREGHETTRRRTDLTPRIVRIYPDFGGKMARVPPAGD
jgi:hypothetical protein